ncbi:MAG: signal recognition particle receptor subunit alpha, partial [Anaerolineales bacterium]|nr:signal recognition particle receptor subunit alpha [Anaerolineales bacterium]
MLNKFRDSLARTRNTFFGQIVNLLGVGDIDDDTWEDLEALLIQADVGVKTTTMIIERLQKRVGREGISRTNQLESVFKEELLSLLPEPPPMTIDEPRLLTVVLIVGANGSGKTTTIGKL